MLLSQILESFFVSHQPFLEKSYPGITKRILCRFFTEELFYKEEVFLGKKRQKIELCLKRIEKGVPFSYISKRKFFWNFSFFVDQRVLIPRPETETLVELIVSDFPDAKSFLEIGTGSGCITLGLSHELKSLQNVTATDISKDAIEVAKINERRLRNFLKSKVNFKVSNLFENLDENEKYDFIVSNPPYIKTSNKAHEKVHEYEPHIALYLSDQEYYDWFETLFEKSFSYLLPRGKFYMEGEETELEKLSGSLENIGFIKVEIKRDLSERKRYLIGTKS